MDTALIIVIAAVALIAVFLIARRASAQKRREMAGDLRVESTRAEERARQAEVRAEEERQAAESRAARADRLDPDTDSPRRRFGLFGRRDDDVDEEQDEERTETNGRPGLRDRLLNR